MVTCCHIHKPLSANAGYLFFFKSDRAKRQCYWDTQLGLCIWPKWLESSFCLVQNRRLSFWHGRGKTTVRAWAFSSPLLSCWSCLLYRVSRHTIYHAQRLKRQLDAYYLESLTKLSYYKRSSVSALLVVPGMANLSNLTQQLWLEGF